MNGRFSISNELRGRGQGGSWRDRPGCGWDWGGMIGNFLLMAETLPPNIPTLTICSDIIFWAT